ncbi:retinal dehydrogenase 2 [Pyrenophora tritici-repentis]|nr:retinal dehydrogenase 2 [Pyrenophora tritici-repentis]
MQTETFGISQTSSLLPVFEYYPALHSIGNVELIEGSSSENYTVYNPANDEIVGEINLADAAEVDAAVAAAREAYENGPWSKFNGAQRAKVMLKLADLIEANDAEITKAEVTAMGQPTSIMGGWIVPMVATTWRYYAGWADKIQGQTYPLEDGAFRITQYEPYGVCAGIGPWNVSIMTMAWKMAPALAAGNTFVFKGSEKSPFSILIIARLFKEAGFPPGVVNIITGAGKTGALMAAHMDIDKISFTGSGLSGRKVVDAANKSNMKRVTLELGGKSPSLVFDDADFDAAIAANSQGFLFNSGQACIATSRLFVQSNIADKFIATLKAHFEGAAGMMGDPSDANTRLGPLADTKQLERVLGYIETGKSEAKLLVGGERKGDKGAFVTPTIFLNPGKDSTIYREEIFGPVLSVLTFEAEEEAIKLANDTSYGLSAAIYTENLARALRVSSKIKAGTIGINSGYAPDNIMPFGGYKQSGMGRELGKEGLLAYMQSKSIRIKL